MSSRKTRRTRRTRKSRRVEALVKRLDQPDTPAETPETAPVRMFTSAPSGRTPMTSSRVSLGGSGESSSRPTAIGTPEAPPVTSGNLTEMALWFIVVVSAVLSVVALRQNPGNPGTTTVKQGPAIRRTTTVPGASPTPTHPPNRAFVTTSASPSPESRTAGRAGGRTGAWTTHRSTPRKKQQPRGSTFTGVMRTPIPITPVGAPGETVTISGRVTARLADGALVRVSGRSILVKGPGAAELKVGSEFTGRGVVGEPLGDLQVVQLEGGP